MHEKIHEKVEQLYLFESMQITPVPSKKPHPHDVKFRDVVFNAQQASQSKGKESSMDIIYNLVIILMFIYLSIKVIGFIIGLVIGGTLWHELTKDSKSKDNK